MSEQTYAIIATGGKQLRVSPGEVVRVERLEAEAGAGVAFDDVRLVARDGEVAVGSPRVEGATVRGTVVTHDRARKVLVFKRKRRKGYRKMRGHRQAFTAVRIDSIDAG